MSTTNNCTLVATKASPITLYASEQFVMIFLNDSVEVNVHLHGQQSACIPSFKSHAERILNLSSR